MANRIEAQRDLTVEERDLFEISNETAQGGRTWTTKNGAKFQIRNGSVAVEGLRGNTFGSLPKDPPSLRVN